MDTDFGYVENVREEDLELGELLVTEYGVEIEVVGLDPLRFEVAPETMEDWGE